ncbi:hypothetical protein IQ07DRAFT_632360 [Pyrenochaeta sp. DS3sAY3a]|nr:hypothetical protein IQ07DRAFT_632360 [Pyrenochaeta sp. DS3sAY3a]
MSPAHTCFGSALLQAFRPSSRGFAASCSVSAFLVPALTRPSRRSYTSGKRRSQQEQRPPFVWPYTEDETCIQPKTTRDRLPSRIPTPAPNVRHDIQQWLAAIDPFLPGHMRQNPVADDDKPPTLTPLDFSFFLNYAQDASFDVLSHLGLVEGRWNAVIWLVKILVQDGRRSIQTPLQHEGIGTKIWPGTELKSLKALTEAPIRIPNMPLAAKPDLSLDDLTSGPGSTALRCNIVKRALGQLWRSLGYIILAATESSQSDRLATMPHVLEIIAHLHHVGFMPDSVYTYRPHEDRYALLQPPTLHMLSSEILGALSDATWNAHEASLKSAQDPPKTKYFLGREVPPTRYQIRAKEVIPELWLELVLWSCLHGGWILDGAAILGWLAEKREEKSWTLISWRELLYAQHQKQGARSSSWSIFSQPEDAAVGPETQVGKPRTLSGEIVASFVDGLVNEVRLGVGTRGIDPSHLIDTIKPLKRLLEASNLSIGSATWDSLMARLLDSGGFVPGKRPDLLLHMFDLATGFGTEISAVNVSSGSDAEVPYFFEPTTVPLNTLHQAMRSFLGNGDLTRAMATLQLLQQYTDDNKQKSVQQFFETLKNTTQSQANDSFTSRLPPVDFPAFDANIPLPLLAKLLDLVTEAELYEVGRWLLFSEDLDGPLIGPELHSHRSISASIVRFGTLAGENELVLGIVKKLSMWNKKYKQQRMRPELLTALLCSQVKLRRWDSVRGMQKYVEDAKTFKPDPVIISTFAGELLRMSNHPTEAIMEAQKSFAELLFAWSDIITRNIENELCCVLAIMFTIDSQWKDLASEWLVESSRQDVKLSTDDFNQLLGGILHGYGSAMGKRIVEEWCYTAPKVFKPYRAPGGLPVMPRLRTGKGQDYENRPEDVEVHLSSSTHLVFQGRVYPNGQTIWSIIRKLQKEVDQVGRQGEELDPSARADARETLQWATQILYLLGFEYEDIVRDLGSTFAALAELEAPAAPNDIGDGGSAEQGLDV